MFNVPLRVCCKKAGVVTTRQLASHLFPVPSEGWSACGVCGHFEATRTIASSSRLNGTTRRDFRTIPREITRRDNERRSPTLKHIDNGAAGLISGYFTLGKSHDCDPAVISRGLCSSRRETTQTQYCDSPNMDEEKGNETNAFQVEGHSKSEDATNEGIDEEKRVPAVMNENVDIENVSVVVNGNTDTENVSTAMNDNTDTDNVSTSINQNADTDDVTTSINENTGVDIVSAAMSENTKTDSVSNPMNENTDTDNVSTVVNENTDTDNVSTKIDHISNSMNEKTETDNITSAINDSTESDNISTVVNENTNTDNVATAVNEATDTDNISSVVSENTDTDNVSSVVSENTDTDNVSSVMSENTDIDNVSSVVSENTDTDKVSSPINENTDTDYVSSVMSESTDTDNVSSPINENNDIDNVSSHTNENTEIDNVPTAMSKATETHHVSTVKDKHTETDNVSPVLSENVDISNITKNTNECSSIENQNNTLNGQPPVISNNAQEQNLHHHHYHIEKDAGDSIIHNDNKTRTINNKDNIGEERNAPDLEEVESGRLADDNDHERSTDTHSAESLSPGDATSKQLTSREFPESSARPQSDDAVSHEADDSTKRKEITNTKGLHQGSSAIQSIFRSNLPSSSILRESSSSFGASSMLKGISDPGNNSSGGGKGDVVMVTGASGFLGQHIVKMLQLKAPHVSEIRVLDLEPFKQKLQYEATKPVKVLVGSITDSEMVGSSVRGVNSVIHVAGMVSWGTFPDFEGMKKVNVQGTLNIINACLEANVSRLIYCSTVDVVVGFEPIPGGDEDTTPIPNEFLFPGYPETKFHGERLVLGASSYSKEDGTHLQTLALRANVMYGELDPHYVVNGLRSAQKSKGTLHQIGDGAAMFQQSYVGNVAWAFVCADVAMKADPKLTSLPFFVPDNTPIQNSFNFMRPYLEARGFQLSKSSLPYGLVYKGLRLSEAVAHALSFITKVNLSAQSCAVAYINMDIFFKGEKARRMLNYEPIFSPGEARSASLPYYESVPL